MRRAGLLIAALTFIGTAWLQAQQILVSVTPETQKISLDSTAAVRIHIDSAQWLHGYHLLISYDPVLVRCRAIRSLQFFQISSLALWYNDTLHGTVTVDEAILGMGSQHGSGDLAELTFVGLNPGSTSLALTELSLRDTSNNEIPAQKQGGSIQIEQPAAVAESRILPRDESARVFPNPCNPSATIRYTCREPGEVVLAVYSILGEEIYRSRDMIQHPGEYSVLWDSRMPNGSPVPSGMYVIRVATPTSSSTTKLIVVR
jgi:hypothetical protein